MNITDSRRRIAEASERELYRTADPKYFITLYSLTETPKKDNGDKENDRNWKSS